MITLYSTGNPKSKVLESKLIKREIQFELNTNLDEILELCKTYKIMSAPILSVDGEMLDYTGAITWLGETC